MNGTQVLDLEAIGGQARQAAKEFLDASGMKAGQLLVVGCSSSEIACQAIGTHSSAEIGRAVFEAVKGEAEVRGIVLAAQCCEHLNRALILEEEKAQALGMEIVNVRPVLKAGGSFAAAAYEGFRSPAAVEHIRAHGGMDIGDTLIGMHLREVAVPVRIPTSRIGGARVICARTRPKYIGGERACYSERWR